MVGHRLEERRDEAATYHPTGGPSARLGPPPQSDSEHRWVKCVGKRGAIARAGRQKDTAHVCEVKRGNIVRQVAVGAAHKKDGSTERRLQVRVPPPGDGGGGEREGWVSAKLFAECDDAEAAAMDERTGGAFREPAAAVAARVLAGHRGVRGARAPTFSAAFGAPTDLTLDMAPLPAPRDAARLRGLDLLVSVVVPTTPNRRWAHRNVYESFRRQSWPRKELVVLETGDDPSKFAGQVWQDPDGYEARGAASPAVGPRVAGPHRFWADLDDDRVTYVYRRADAALGTKRNALGEMARGAVLVAFDDDDVYRAHYVDAMVHALLFECGDEPAARTLWDPTADRDVDATALAARARQPRLVKLASFACYNAPRNVVQACDLRPPPGTPRDALGRYADPDCDDYHSRFWGYGFSYVYTAALIARSPFPDITFGEDYAFVRDAAYSAGAACRAFGDDARNPAVLHVLHGESSTMTPTDRVLARPADCRRVFGAELAALLGDGSRVASPETPGGFFLRHAP